MIWAPRAARRAEMVDLIASAGWLPLVADTEQHAVQMLADAPPDLFVLAVDDDDAAELSIIDEVRAGPDGEHVPVVCVLERHHRQLTLEAFGRRADDVVSGHPDPTELLARFRTRIERPPVPRSHLVVDPVTGALTSEAFAQQLSKEEERVRRGGDPGALAFIALDELPELTSRFGSRARDELLAQVVRLIKADGRKLDYVGWRRGMVAILLPDTPMKGAQARFDRLVRKIYEREFVVDGAPLRVTPVIGYTQTVEKATVEQFEDRAWDALMYQADQLDLHPTKWVAAMSKRPTTSNRFKRGFDRYRTTFQVILQQLAALVLPFLAYWMLDSLGADITGVVYLGLVVALGVTATLIWGESHTAIEPTVPPDAPDRPPPRASAIIAAYLPNEAGTVVETVEAFLQQDYPDLEIILAYNTPTRLDVEDELRAIADRDPRFVPLRVEGSVSKAQNVNAALARVTGEFLGLFDADHHPAPGSFHRAWRWIADGAGVVQGHCVIRNGDTNLVTRLVATEFEAIYAVSHPGRARLHGFGIFGGSNGYWRTSLLHRIRMRGSMLTEDIDSSMRVVQSGEVIISDPDLVSTELAPDTAEALWNQRLRWAQGWSQVSLRHLIKMTRALPRFRQRLGAAYLLGWREIYPWISLQMFPLLGYWWFQGEPAIEWFVPIFVFTTLLTFSAGPTQIWYAWRLAHPSIKRHKKWFVLFGISSLLFYTEIKNVVARTAHLKELMRERKWKVTPRTGSVALDAEAAHADQADQADQTHTDHTDQTQQTHTQQTEQTHPDQTNQTQRTHTDQADQTHTQQSQQTHTQQTEQTVENVQASRTDRADADRATPAGHAASLLDIPSATDRIAELADRWALDENPQGHREVVDLSISPNALAEALDRLIADDDLAAVFHAASDELTGEHDDLTRASATGTDADSTTSAPTADLTTPDLTTPDLTTPDPATAHDDPGPIDDTDVARTSGGDAIGDPAPDLIDDHVAPATAISEGDHLAAPPARAATAPSARSGSSRSAARRRRSRRAATTRRRRHHEVASAAPPSRESRPTVYDRAREVTIYDFEREEAERPGRRPYERDPVDRTPVVQRAAAPHDTETEPTSPPARERTPMPLLTPRLYEPDFLRRLVHRDHPDQGDDGHGADDRGDDAAPAPGPTQDGSPAPSHT